MAVNKRQTAMVKINVLETMNTEETELSKFSQHLEK